MVDSGVADDAGVLSTFWGGMMELETAWVEVVAWVVLDGEEEEEGATDVLVGAAALLERTLQRLEEARFFFWGTTTGSGAALGMAARWASSRWWALRSMWGLARAERAREQTTMALEKYMVVRVERATSVGRVGERLDGACSKKERERAYVGEKGETRTTGRESSSRGREAQEVKMGRGGRKETGLPATDARK